MINIVGWWCVFEDGEPVAVFADKRCAEGFVEVIGGNYSFNQGRYQAQQITAKVDFTPEQIQDELTRMAVESVTQDLTYAIQSKFNERT
jgi:hypothetical protein